MPILRFDELPNRLWRVLQKPADTKGVPTALVIIVDRRLTPILLTHTGWFRVSSFVDILDTEGNFRWRPARHDGVFYSSRRCHARDWSPALCSRGLGSGASGSAFLPDAFQQTSIHPASVAGHSLPDALRRLDLPRSRGTAARTSRVAHGAATLERARLHHGVSLLAAATRRHHRERVGRIGAPTAPQFASRPATSGRGG